MSEVKDTSVEKEKSENIVVQAPEQDVQSNDGVNTQNLQKNKSGIVENSQNQDNGGWRYDAGELKFKSDVEGIKYDFNYGARVSVPEGKYKVNFVDQDQCLCVYSAEANNVVCSSSKKYFINWRIEVYKDDKLVFEHNINLKGKKVYIKFPQGVLGDVLAYFPYVEEFRKRHLCELYCSMTEEMAGLFKRSYPKIHYIKEDEVPKDIYATYLLGVFFPPNDRNHQPIDFRLIGLHTAAAMILGLDDMQIPRYVKLKLLPKKKKRIIEEPYVCIAAQASGQCKYWNNGEGWINVVRHLKEKGYRVICIDRDEVAGSRVRYNMIPYGAEDFTGTKPLQDRVDLLYNAEFFVGLSSGLSWLAQGVGKDIVLISGFTLPYTEFPTPYRVINYQVCTGCWNECVFQHSEYDWCPRFKNTTRHYECTRYITAAMVNKVIDRLIADQAAKKQQTATDNVTAKDTEQNGDKE